MQSPQLGRRMEQPQHDSARVVRIVEAGQSSSSTFAAMFSRSPLSLQLQDQLATAMQQHVKNYRTTIKRVIAEEQMLEVLTAASQSSCMPIHIRSAAKVPRVHIRHEPTSIHLADRFAALHLEYQEKLLAEAIQHTQQSVAALTADMNNVKPAAVADMTATFDAAIAHSEHKDEPAVRSLLANALTLLDLDLSNVQSQQRQAALQRKQQQDAAAAKKLEQQQQRQQRQQRAGTSSAATAAAAGAAAAAAITAAAAAAAVDPADAAMGDADPDALPLNQEQQMQQQAAATAANQPVTLNQVAVLVQQGITAALAAAAAASPPPLPAQQRAPPRRTATPQRARPQQQPTAPGNRSRSASRHRAGSHRPAAGTRNRSADRRQAPPAQQPATRQQQPAQRHPNGHGGPAGPRNARGNSRRTDTAGNSRRLGRRPSH